MVISGMDGFSPDARIPLDVLASPNHGERREGAEPDMIILHYTGMQDARAALQKLTTDGTDVSAHYFIFEDGGIVQLVPEARRAWHAGEACWAGITDINSHSIGIEVANPGHDWGYPSFPMVQIDAVIALCRDILARRTILQERVLAHSDVAPARKQDPGEKFPWHVLHQADIGHWVTPCMHAEGPMLDVGDTGPLVAELRSLLRSYGYWMGQGTGYDPATAAVVRAFQRHFHPNRTDGRADAATRTTLKRLVASLEQKSRPV